LVDLASQSFVEAWELRSVHRAQRGALDACGANDLSWQWHGGGVFSIQIGVKVSEKKGAVENKLRDMVACLFTF
jgi:hypothetical protein